MVFDVYLYEEVKDGVMQYRPSFTPLTGLRLKAMDRISFTSNLEKWEAARMNTCHRIEKENQERADSKKRSEALKRIEDE